MSLSFAETSGSRTMSLRALVFHPDQKTEEATLELSNISTYSNFLESSSPFLQNIPLETTVSFFNESLYTLTHRKVLLCFNPKSDSYHHIDTEDGQMVKDSYGSFFRFLRPSSDLPTCPNFFPVLNMWPRTEFFISTARGNLEAAPAGVIFDPQFLVAMAGVAVGRKFFWTVLLNYGEFAEADTGKEFRREQIPGAAVDKRNVLLLLQEGDPVPRVKVKKNTELVVLVRRGAEMSVEKGRLRCVQHQLPDADVELWAAGVEDFQKSFKTAAGRPKLLGPLNKVW